MAATTTENTTVVEEVIDALTGSEAGASTDLRAQMERAAREFDARTAASFCKALLEHLTEEPGSIRALEALMILGLAHPKVLAKHHIPLSQEGRRLAVLLEKAGEVERAQTLLEVLAAHAPRDRGIDHDLASMMRRTGNADRLVDRYLRRAEQAMREGRRREAVTWLREALLVDGTRRDVARMIRDLRYEEAARLARWRSRGRLALCILVLGGAIAAAVMRELGIQQEYASLAPAVHGDRMSVNDRLDRLNTLIAANPLWLGMFAAGRERAELRNEIDRIDAVAADAARAVAEERARQLATAEAARFRGRSAAESGDFSGALQELRLALENAPAGWEPRAQVEADVRAIVEWQRERGIVSGEPHK